MDIYLATAKMDFINKILSGDLVLLFSLVERYR